MVHVVGPFPSFWFPAAWRLVDDPRLEPGGEDGRLGAAEEKPDMVPGTSPPGDVGNDCAICSKPLCFVARCEGVDALRGILCWRMSLPCLNDCEWERDRPLLSQSPLLST